MKWLEQGDARRLLALMDGGALPALRALDWSDIVPSYVEMRKGNPGGAADDIRDQCALLERLSDTRAVTIQNTQLGRDVVWERIGALISRGGLANLT